jgi:hypothetical protein
MRWVSLEAARALNLDPSLTRALEKAHALLSSRPPLPAGEGRGEGQQTPARPEEGR